MVSDLLIYEDSDNTNHLTSPDSLSHTKLESEESPIFHNGVRTKIIFSDSSEDDDISYSDKDTNKSMISTSHRLKRVVIDPKDMLPFPEEEACSPSRCRASISYKKRLRDPLSSGEEWATLIPFDINNEIHGVSDIKIEKTQLNDSQDFDNGIYSSDGVMFWEPLEALHPLVPGEAAISSRIMFSDNEDTEYASSPPVTVSVSGFDSVIAPVVNMPYASCETYCDTITVEKSQNIPAGLKRNVLSTQSTNQDSFAIAKRSHGYNLTLLESELVEGFRGNIDSFPKPRTNKSDRLSSDYTTTKSDESPEILEPAVRESSTSAISAHQSDDDQSEAETSSDSDDSPAIEDLISKLVSALDKEQKSLNSTVLESCKKDIGIISCSLKEKSYDADTAFDELHKVINRLKILKEKNHSSESIPTVCDKETDF